MSQTAAAAPHITVADGDGVGPEITASVLEIIAAAKAPITPEFVQVGEKVFLSGNTSGIPQEAWDSLARARVMLKAPITTPQGGGYKSVNVTLRKTLGLFANVRPCRSYAPIIATRHPAMDVVIVRENEEDLYAGIEHRQTANVAQCLKLITRPGSERISRYAFEYARKHNRRKVTLMVKDNIMKMTDGLFHRVFDEVAAEYPQIEATSQIVDFGMANFVHRPNTYDVVLLPNLYGDILSDIAAQMTGSVGIGGSVNIGASCAIFEAIHGSAPDLPRDVANPSGLLMAAVEMLRYLGYRKQAATVANAWLKTLEDGIHTRDIAGERTKEIVGTRKFTDAVLARLGEKPTVLAAVQEPADASDTPQPIESIAITAHDRPPETKTLVGVDIFVDYTGTDAAALAAAAQAAAQGSPFKLVVMDSRGVKVWPEGHRETFTSDHWRMRFEAVGDISGMDVAQLLVACAAAELNVIKTEHLYNFDGKPGYQLAQGQ